MGHSGGAHGYTLPVSSILTQPMHSLACTFISCALLSCRQKYKYKAQKRLFDKELTPITSSFSSSVECTDGPAAVDVPLRGFSVVIIGRLHRTKVRRRWEGTTHCPFTLGVFCTESAHSGGGEAGGACRQPDHREHYCLHQ